MIKLNLLQRITLTGLMIALYVIATRLVMVPITNLVRLSAGPAVLIFSSILLGPISGAIVGGCGDLMGALFMPYLGMAINPWMTVSYTVMGAIPGLFIILYNHIKFNEKIIQLIYLSFLGLIWVGILVFSLIANDVHLFNQIYELNQVARILIPLISLIIMVAIAIFTYWINHLFKKPIEEDSRIPSPFCIGLIVMFIEVIFTLCINPYLKTAYYGYNTYWVVFFTSLLIALIYIPANTFIVSYLCLLSVKVVKIRE